MTIGPHEGKELDLMLAGIKPLAAFSDIVPESGMVPEEIIPKQAFAPYVAADKIKKFEQIIILDSGEQLYQVCYSLPDESWRAESYLWLRKMLHTKQIKYDDTCDVILGKLLGYEEKDIAHFLRHQKSLF